MRHFSTFILFMSPIASVAQTLPEDNQNVMRVEWGLTAAFDLNIPGDWLSIDTSQETLLGYGGRFGGVMALKWTKGWEAEVAFTIGLDRLPLPVHTSQSFKVNLDRWSLSLPVTAGYIFDATEEMGIGPIAGIDLSYSLRNHLQSTATVSHAEEPLWKPFNLSWGFGCAMKFGRYEVDVTGWFGTINLLRRNSLNLPSPCYPNVVRVGVKYFL